ncbi:MAG: alpha-L-arabinofuranosidase, partial [Limisphaerales bacterium]
MSWALLLPGLLLLFWAGSAGAQASLSLYTSYLVNGFQNWSWATVNLSASYDGSNCVSVTDGTNYQALYIENAPFNTSPYGSLDFWINGGSGGGQSENVIGLINGNSQAAYSLGTLPANTWTHFTIPLASLGVANTADCTGFWIQGAISGSQPPFYVSGLQLLGAPAPATAHLGVNAANVLRKADTRWFGFNTAIYDNDFDSAATSNLLKQCGCTTLRYPGGSMSDVYNWATDLTVNDPNRWATPFSSFIQIATNLGAQVFITVNYGTGTSNEAAAWVASANVTNHCNFKYWEIGNEVYGTNWEVDSNSLPHDPVTYATRAAGYIQLMKARDPTIKIGAVAVPGEDADVNYPNETVQNPVTGATHSGWTPLMLATFKKMGIYPDFLIYHYYPEYTSSGADSTDSDPLLLQVAGNPAPG